MINYKIKKEKDNRYIIMKVVQETITDKFPVAVLNSEEKAKEYIENLKGVLAKKGGEKVDNISVSES